MDGAHFARTALAAMSANSDGASRREFLETMLAASVATKFQTESASFADAAAAPLPDAVIETQFNVNGRDVRLAHDPRVTLLDALREHLRLTGTKKGCDHGQCGSCTVLMDGVRINSCLALAVMHDGHEITTIEGLAQGAELHPVQAAFLEHDAFQCGYCTPGQIMSATALASEPVEFTDDSIRENMSGNI